MTPGSIKQCCVLLQVPAITVVLAGYMGCNADAAIIMFAISIGFNGMTVPGSKSSMLDFSPKYSGKEISNVPNVVNFFTVINIDVGTSPKLRSTYQ